MKGGVRDGHRNKRATNRGYINVVVGFFIWDYGARLGDIPNVFNHRGSIRDRIRRD